MNITFPNLPCYIVSLDVMDVSGEHQNNVDHSIFKTRIDKAGKSVQEKKRATLGSHHPAPTNETVVAICGSCYSATPPESGCCYTCADVQEAYEKMKWSLTDMENIDQVCSLLIQHSVSRKDWSRISRRWNTRGATCMATSWSTRVSLYALIL